MKKSVKILIILLCLIIVGFVTFFILNKVINKKEETTILKENQSSTNNESDNKSNADASEINFQSLDFVGNWENEEDETQLTINSDGTFQADHYTESSTIFGDYTINGENIEFICKKDDSTYNKKWKGQISKDSNNNLTLKVNLYDEETILNKRLNNDADNYNKYIGTWVDENNSSELNVLTIGNNQLAFSWTIYRIAGIDNVVVPMENNKAVFYYQGYDDKNYNSKQDEGEYYYRRATIQLNTESININIENITSSEYDITKARDFDGSVYVDEGTYTYNINKNNEQSEITREDALELGEKMYKEVEGYYKKMSEIHPNNFVQTTETAETMAKIEDNTFMENVKKLLIKDAFNNFMEYYHIEDRNGEYYASTGGMGNNPLYISTNDLTIKNMDNYTITYIATSVYDDIDYTGTETKDYEFVLTKIDGEWKVENFTLPY